MNFHFKRNKKVTMAEIKVLSRFKLTGTTLENLISNNKKDHFRITIKFRKFN